MAVKVETLSTQVKKLKTELQSLRQGGAATVAQKRKKKPITEKQVLRAHKKRLRRVASRLKVEKARAARKKGAAEPKAEGAKES